jgi:hypothetical protein
VPRLHRHRAAARRRQLLGARAPIPWRQRTRRPVSRALPLDPTVALPSLARGQDVHLTLHLHTDDVGRPLRPVAADPGPPGSSEVGTWPGAQLVPCATAAGPYEACVPGGAFWMGDPLLSVFGTQSSDQERLVVMSP